MYNVQQSIPGRVSDFYHGLVNDPVKFPVKFSYDGRTFRGLPAEDFRLTARTSRLTLTQRRDSLTFAGPRCLTVRLETAYWLKYGFCEWTVYFENPADEDTAVLSDVFCCDLEMPLKSACLRGILGDHKNQYRPYCRSLSSEPVYFESLSGRPTHVDFPYFDLRSGSEGAMFAIGWAGSWSADFREESFGSSFLGRSTVCLKAALHPGESIRTALTLFAPYTVPSGENADYYACNLWRRFFIECNMPRADRDGGPIRPFSTCSLASDTGLPNSDGSISERSTTWKPSLDKMYAENVKTDFRWFDAGWYTDPRGMTVESDWYGTVGSWTLDPVKWPGHTFRDSVDYGHAHGQRTLMWFEPERVTDPESLAANYGYDIGWAIRRHGTDVITNNIGDPDCLEWTTRRICSVLTDNGVDMYREDNNSDPGPLWSYLDEKDGRSGISECRMVTAHYKMWDDIISATSNNGGCAFCDSCASGGGRNDLESLRRGVPVLRSDSDRESTALRLSMTASFCRWVPFCGANTKEKKWQLDPTGISDVYTWRASYLPILNVDSQFVQDPDQDFDMLRFGLDEWNSLKDLLTADFYTLTPWHSREERDGFTAFSYFDPQSGKGIVLILRMEDCEQDAFALTLPYIKRGMSAVLTDADNGEKTRYSAGMKIVLPEKRTARLLRLQLG